VRLQPLLPTILTDKGSRSFIWQLRPWPRITLRARTLDEARQEAAGLLAKATRGQDPTPETGDRDGKGPKLREVVHRYLEYRGDTLRSRDRFLADLERHVLPTWGSKPYFSFTRPDLANIRDSIIAKAKRDERRATNGRHAAATVLRNLHGPLYALR
jgi:hypothetical protein